MKMKRGKRRLQSNQCSNTYWLWNWCMAVDTHNAMARQHFLQDLRRASRNEGQSSGVRLKGTETPHWLVIIVARFSTNYVWDVFQGATCNLFNGVKSFTTRFVLATQFLYGSPLHDYHPSSPRPILDVTILLGVATPVRGLKGGTLWVIPRHRTDLRG